MPEIEIGSKWRNDNVGSTSVVLAVVRSGAGRDYVIVERSYGFEGESIVMVANLEDFLQVNEPFPEFFEVGKVYKFRDSASPVRFSVTEIRTFKGVDQAIAERTGSEVLTDKLVFLNEFDNFEEV